MSNIANSSANLTASINGRTYGAQGVNTGRIMTGSNDAIVSYAVSNAWTQLPIPANITGGNGIGELLIVPTAVVSGGGTVVKVALDNAGAQIVSDGVPIGQPFLWPFPSAAPYLKTDAGVIQIQAGITER